MAEKGERVGHTCTPMFTVPLLIYNGQDMETIQVSINGKMEDYIQWNILQSLKTRESRHL